MLGLAAMGAGVALLFAHQDPEPPPAPQAAQVQDWDDAHARKAAKELERALRDRDAGLADRMRAIEAVAQGRNRLLVKPLAKVLQHDESVVLRKRAAELIAQQPPEAARPVLVGMLRQRDDQTEPAVVTALVRGLSKCYDSHDWPTVEEQFARAFGPDYVALQQAILDLVIEHEEKQAWKLLVEHLDEPIPRDVHGAENPPAEYWEKRWKAWWVWRGQVKEALFVITGQRFSTSEEARAWIRANGAEHGLR